MNYSQANKFNQLCNSIKLLNNKIDEQNNKIDEQKNINDYNALLLKHSRNSLRIADAMNKQSSTNQIKQLTKTSWTEGKVLWNFKSFDNIPNFDIVVRWKRSLFDVEFDHELSTLDPSNSVGVGQDYTNTIKSITGTITSMTTTPNPDLNKIDDERTWMVTEPQDDFRFMLSGGDLLLTITKLILFRELSGDLPLYVDLIGPQFPAEFFSQNKNNTDPTFDGTFSESQVWNYVPGISRPNGIPGTYRWKGFQNMDGSYNIQHKEFRTPLLLEGLGTNATNRPNSTQKIVHIERQEATESNDLFLSRVFGTEASRFVRNIVRNEKVLTYTGGANIEIDSQVIAYLASCGFTRPTVYEPLSDEESFKNTQAGTSISITHGKILLGGEIFNAGYTTNPSISQEIYSLWADNKIDIADSIMVSLPSNVIHNANITNIVNFGNPSRPHAKLDIEDSVREFIRPSNDENSNNESKAVYLNYVKVESLSVLKGFGGSNSPGSAVWFFWRPGYSIWVYGGVARNNNDIVEKYTDRYTDGVTEDYKATALEWAVMELLGNIDGIGFNYTERELRWATNPPPYSEIYRPVNYFENINETGIIVNYLPIIAGVSPSPITLFAGKTKNTLDYDNAIFAGLQGTPYTTLLGNLNSADHFPISSDNPINSGTKPPYVDTRNVNFDFVNTLNTVDVLEFDDIMISSFELTKNINDNNILNLNEKNMDGELKYLGRFNYGMINYKAFEADGIFNSLFPPIYYLQTSQSYSPEIRNLTQRLNYFEQYLNDYVEVSIKSVLTSIDKIGLVNELVSRKIIFLENEIKIRYDQLITYIEDAIGNLTDLILLTSRSAEDIFTQDFGGGGEMSIFIGIFMNVVPLILGAIPVVGGAASAITKSATDFGTNAYRDSVIAESASRLLSRASRLFQEGEERNGLAYAMFGTLAAAPFLESFIRDGSNMIETDMDTGQPKVDADVPIQPQILTPNLLNTLESLEENTLKEEDSQLIINKDAIPDILPFTEANAEILIKIRELENIYGYEPPYDDTSPIL